MKRNEFYFEDIPIKNNDNSKRESLRIFNGKYIAFEDGQTKKRIEGILDYDHSNHITFNIKQKDTGIGIKYNYTYLNYLQVRREKSSIKSIDKVIDIEPPLPREITKNIQIGARKSYTTKEYEERKKRVMNTSLFKTKK